MTAEAASKVKITLMKYIVMVEVVFELLKLENCSIEEAGVFGLSMA